MMKDHPGDVDVCGRPFAVEGFLQRCCGRRRRGDGGGGTIRIGIFLVRHGEKALLLGRMLAGWSLVDEHVRDGEASFGFLRLVGERRFRSRRG